MTRPSPAMRVGICIATYRRPRMLATLLKALDRQAFQKARPPLVTVVVIDNDVAESARATVERAAVRARWPLCYGVEPRRGISYARNRGVVAVGQTCDFLVFVDDDELPRRNWLDELLFAQARENADVVAGPVLPRFAEVPPAWVDRGRFFLRPRCRAGPPLSAGSGGSARGRAGGLRELPRPFPPRCARGGGEYPPLCMPRGRLGPRGWWPGGPGLRGQHAGSHQ